MVQLLHKHLIIHGEVQGVGYRWSMVEAARRLGVNGWVRNRREGTVEAFASGDAAAVDALLAWAREGPAGARVTRVAIEDAPEPATVPKGFAQRETL
jgi:acylphosphatase